jgi:hypothetical protein
MRLQQRLLILQLLGLVLVLVAQQAGGVLAGRRLLPLLLLLAGVRPRARDWPFASA